MAHSSCSGLSVESELDKETGLPAGPSLWAGTQCSGSILPACGSPYQA